LAKAKEPEEPRRLNRAVGVGEALNGVLDTALRKRGFATRDVLTRWTAIAPKPYDAVAVPDQLKWPRGAGHEGATLYLRCAPGHALALSHEAPLIVAAVNRYFGYFLVREVRLSAEPMVATKKKPGPPAALPGSAAAARTAAAGVEDAGLRTALESLGTGVLGRKTRNSVTKA
jgi:hypothetical protein